MYFSRALVVFVVCCVATTYAYSALTSSTIYNNLVHYANFANAGYCGTQTVLGATLVASFTGSSQAVAYVYRDTTNQVFIVTWKGSTTESDWIADLTVEETSYSGPLYNDGCLLWGVNLCLVHSGFLGYYNGIGSQVIQALQSARTGPYAAYSFVITGHSLGGALAPFSALAVKSAFSSATVYLYTYGQPRVGNSYFGTALTNAIGSGNIFRGTHTSDEVPDLIPKVTGLYQHYQTEYWISADPASEANTVVCTSEESDCNDQYSWNWDAFISLFTSSSPHDTYFGVSMDSC
jgi:hypothetical protein